MSTYATSNQAGSGLEDCAGDAALLDGTRVHLRAIRPDDAEGLRRFHERLSDETVYLRFFGPHPHLGVEELERFTNVDYLARLAIVAALDDRLVAVGRYEVIPATTTAEVAFVVADALQHLGLGTLLLEQLALAARRRGVTTFVTQTLGTNYLMQDVFGHAGFAVDRRAGAGVVDLRFPIAPTGAYLDAVAERAITASYARLARRLPAAKPSPVGLICPAGRAAGWADDLWLGGPEPVTVELQPDDGLSAALGYLAALDDVEVVAVAADVRPPYRRLAAIGRRVSQRKPVVVATTRTDLDGLWAQTGFLRSAPGSALAEHVLRLLEERRRRAWQPPGADPTSDVGGCDLSAARRVMRAIAPTSGPACLDAHRTRELLAAYRIPFQETGALHATLVAGHQPSLGVAVQLFSPNIPGDRRAFRLLPLTDRDAEELLVAASPTGQASPEGLDLLRRLARLVDDQPAVAQIRLSPDSAPAWSVWVGPARGTGDDPFVRTLVGVSEP